ncbi:capsid assembly scaffolding protein Gp46 family protein [Exiguobacterium oxidotolerans]|uniref:capsid assembly scaffolding protein Gp46 family protein n=1 Tax=Exiguobacterium oxidotolerans TaxID=223958 RepID=UPI000493DA57|nr:DUF4355 domain-containing protein [Exiguobacterium oxidotolerans]
MENQAEETVETQEETPNLEQPPHETPAESVALTPEIEQMIAKMVQSETDKVRTGYTKKLKESQAELDKLKTSQMSESEKYEYERAKVEQEKAEWAAEKERQELELKRATNKHYAARVIATKSIPADLAESFETLIMDDDPQAIDAKADTILALAETLAAKKVEEQLGGRNPKHRSPSTLTKKSIAEMSYGERVALQESDPAAYEALKNKK